MSSQNIVKLNIGGTVFQTSISTLTRQEGFFKTILETDVPVTKDDAGCIFIDRNPKHFGKILDFMRDGHVATSGSVEKLEEIRNEAQYYLLDGLVDLCNGELEKRNVSKNCDDIQVIESDVQLLQVVANPQKPVLIIYYPKDNVSFFWRFCCPQGFNIIEFLNKWRGKLDTYFRSYTTNGTETDTRWTWSLHFDNSTNNFGYFEYQENVHFTTQLEQSINKFVTEHNITC